MTVKANTDSTSYQKNALANALRYNIYKTLKANNHLSDAQSLRQLFNSIDESGDGCLQDEELLRALEVYFGNSENSRQRSLSLIKAMDINQTGIITIDEFLSCLHPDILQVQSIQKAFKLNSYSAQDLAGFTNTDPIEWISIINEFGKEQNSNITNEEAVAFLSKYASQLLNFYKMKQSKEIVQSQPKISQDLGQVSHLRKLGGHARSRYVFFHNIDRELNQLKEQCKRFDQMIKGELNKLGSHDIQAQYLRPIKKSSTTPSRIVKPPLHQFQVRKGGSIFGTARVAKNDPQQAHHRSKTALPRASFPLGTLSEPRTAQNVRKLKSRQYRLNSIKDVVTQCQSLENTYRNSQTQIRIRSRHTSQEYDELLHDLLTRQELADIVKDPIKLQEYLRIKKNYRKIEQLISSNANNNHKEYTQDIMQLMKKMGPVKVWKFQTPSMNERTEKLLYSLGTTF